MRMARPKSFFRLFTERGPLIALAVAGLLLAGVAGPASAQFFNFGGFGGFGGPPQRPPPPPQRNNGGGGWFGGDLFTPFQRQAPRRVVREDYSRAPPPEKRETVPERNVLVLGDAMADWLAYGLEDAYADQPDIGVIRKFKTYSGLIKYQPKGEPADWAAAAKGILATEKPDAIVVMLGLNDRIPLREPAAEKSDGKSSDKKAEKTDARAKPETKPETAMPPPPSRMKKRSIANCRRTTPPTIAMPHRPFRPRRARAPPTASMNFAKSVGSNSTTRKSTR